MARADEILNLQDAFDDVAEEVGEGVKFGNIATNWSNTNAANVTCIAMQLSSNELLEVGGVAPGKIQQIALKQSSLSNVPPSQQVTIARFRNTSYRVQMVDTTDALYLITLVDPSD